MKKILAATFTITLFACNNSKSAPEETAPPAEVKAMTPTEMHGYTPEYSASFVMDSAKNTETVLALWKEFQDGDLSKSSPHFADTVSFFMADGSAMTGPKDSLIKAMQGYRNSFKSVDSKVEAIFAVRSTDKDENFVAVWGVEFPIDSKGKKDTVSLQETWGFDKAGKVNLMFQASRKGMLPPPPPK